MASEKVQIHVDPAVEDYLIDRGKKLNQAQREELGRAFEKLQTDPDVGFEPSLPLSTQYGYEHYLGDGFHLCIYYDVERRSAGADVRVRRVSIAMKM